MKVFWSSSYNAEGGGLGFAVHTIRLREALAALGIESVKDPDAADVAIFVDIPSDFKPVHGLKNVLFTQAEFSEPFFWGESVARADALVLSSQYGKAVCAKHYKGPIEVCPLGVDPGLFPFVERSMPSSEKPFRVLYVGNGGFFPRKGIDLVFSAWADWQRSGRMPSNAELWVKTTDFPFPNEGGGSAWMVSPQTLAVQDDHLNYYSLHNLKAAPGTAAMDPTAGTMFKNMNRFRSFDYLASIPSKASELPGMAVDLRRLTTNELADLYRSSHVFLFPSRGEGWGLTLSDALASGLPSIWTHNTAPVDYTGPEFGYPLTRLTFRDFGTVRGPNGLGLPCFCSEPDEREIIEKLEEIISDYPTAVAKGRKASEHMHMNYSWAKAGERLAEILEGVLAHSLG